MYEVKTPTVSIEYNELSIQVTLNLAKWPWVKVKTHPDHHSLCEKEISNYYVTPKERYGPDIFLIKWPWTYPHDLGSRTWHTLVSYKYCNWWKKYCFQNIYLIHNVENLYHFLSEFYMDWYFKTIEHVQYSITNHERSFI